MKFNKQFVVAAGIAVCIAAGFYFVRPSPPAPVRVQFGIKQPDTFLYEGVDNKDALTLLKEITDVTLDTVGMVSSINGRMADAEKKEFWAFYVNGDMASVGPADYVTKTGEKIEWKIENY